MLILNAVFISIINTLIIHTLLTKKTSYFFALRVFVLNALVVSGFAFFIRENIQDAVLLKYLLYVVAFLYCIYIFMVFTEPMSQKLFAMFSIWVISVIAHYVATLIVGVYPNRADFVYYQTLIALLRGGILLLVFLATFYYLGKPYKKVLDIVSDKTIYIMLLYPVTAFLLLINNYGNTAAELIANFKTIYNLILFLGFIILGYILVFVGISAASINISLQDDLTTSENEVAKQYYKANYDHLTGIANRSLIMHQLSKSIDIANRSKKIFALYMFDLDHFKKINDDYGHLIGDKALKYCAETIQNVLRTTDFIGRFGGDEFLIIQQFIEADDNIIELITRIFDKMKEPLVIGELVIPIQLSIGVSIYPKQTEKKETLINYADIALYEAKKVKGFSYVIYNGTSKHKR